MFGSGVGGRRFARPIYVFWRGRAVTVLLLNFEREAATPHCTRDTTGVKVREIRAASSGWLSDLQ